MISDYAVSVAFTLIWHAVYLLMNGLTGIGGKEGRFIILTFWLIEAMSRVSLWYYRT